MKSCFIYCSYFNPFAVGNAGAFAQQPTSEQVLSLLYHSRREELCYASKEGVVQRIWRVGAQVIVGITKLGGIGPHQRRDFFCPEWSMVATRQYREMLLESEPDLQSSDRQFGRIGCRLPQHGVHEFVGETIGQQPQKIALVSDFDRQARRDTL